MKKVLNILPSFIKKILPLCFVFVWGGLWAQNHVNEIQGRIVDASDSQPVEFATVALMRSDSSIVTGTSTDADGLFHLRNIPFGNYLLRVSFIGYNANTIPLSVSAGMGKLDDIRLDRDATMLQEVVITDKVPLVEQKLDKLVMNVSQSAFAQVGNNSLELLRKAPGVTIDKDGNVMLNGQAVAIWIDGRPSQLDGKSLEALLRSTDASSIDKIEIIANPSAKYDAAGQGGIINLKTKRTLMQGLNGTIGGSYSGMAFNRQLEGIDERTDYLQNQNVNINLNYRTSKTNTFLNLNEMTYTLGIDMLTKTSWENAAQNLYEQSAALYNIKISNFMLKLGNDWFIDKKNTLGFIFSMPITRMYEWADTNENYSFQKNNDVETQHILTDASTDYKMKQYSANLNYTHIFNEMKAAELTANLDYFHNNGWSQNRQFNYIRLSGISPLFHPYLTTLTADNNIDIYSAKVDWQSVVWGSFMLEAGGKWALSHTANTLDNVSDNYDASSASMIHSDIDTRFNYDEHVGAGYLSLAHQFSPKWTAKVGLRGEYTYSLGDWVSADTVSRRHYFDLFPTLFVGYNPSMFWRFNLSYTRRIQRPNYDQLNPFQNYVDAYTSHVGNPNLSPCYSHNLYLSAGYGQFVTFYANYMYMDNVLTRIPVFNSATGEQLLTWANFGLTTVLGCGITLNEIPLGKLFSLMVNLNGGQLRNEEGSYKNTTLYGNGYVALTCNLPKDWKLQLDGWASSPMVSGYLHTHSNYSCNFAVKKSCLDKRLVFSLEVDDLFRTMNQDFEMVEATGITSVCTQKLYIQKIRIGLSWTFGAAQKPLRHRKVGVLDEASRTSSSSSMGSMEK